MDLEMSCATEKLICGSVWTICTTLLIQERTEDNSRLDVLISTIGMERNTGDTTINSSFNRKAD